MVADHQSRRHAGAMNEFQWGTTMRIVTWGMTVAVGMALLSTAGPALAGSQCFKNLDNKPIFITLRYANGDYLVMNLKPADKRRFDNVKNGDSYCFSFNPISPDECPNRNPVHLDSCTDTRLTR